MDIPAEARGALCVVGGGRATSQYVIGLFLFLCLDRVLSSVSGEGEGALAFRFFSFKEVIFSAGWQKHHFASL